VKKKRKKNTEKKRSSGLIIGLLNMLCDKIMSALKCGMFARMLSNGENTDELLDRSLIFGCGKVNPEGGKRSIRRYMLRIFDESVVLGFLRRLKKALLSCRLNVFGSYMMSFGIFSMIAFFVRYFVVDDNPFDKYLFAEIALWTPVIIVLFSIPLISSSRNVSTLFSESAIVRGVLEDELGVSEEKFEPIENNNGGGAYFATVFLGILSGLVSQFVSPELIILLLIGAVGIWLVMSIPEVGVLASVALAPLLGFLARPTAVLTVMLSVTFASFFFKVLIGKRYVKFKLTDALVAIFGLLMMFGGIVTTGGRESLTAALIYTDLLLIYFLAINLMNTREWLARCVDAIVFPAAIVAVFGILSYSNISMPDAWLDSNMFSDISSRAVSTFENPNTLATYLIMTAPFLWIKMRDGDATGREKMLALIGSAASLVCIVLTWSRGGWIGYLMGLVIYLFVSYRYTLKYFFVIGLAVPAGYFLLPKSVLTRFMSIGNLNDSSTYYRLLTWKGSLKMFLDNIVGGVGVGTSAFNQMYPIYSYMGTEATSHSHNLFLQIGLELGIVGLAVFVAIMFGIARNGFGGLKKIKERNSRLIISAGIASIAAATAHGLVDHIWYNYRVFFIFWTVAALICACARVEAADRAYRTSPTGEEDDEAVLKMIFREN